MAVVVMMTGAGWAAVTLGIGSLLGPGSSGGGTAGAPSGVPAPSPAAKAVTALTVYPTSGVVGTELTFNATHFGDAKAIKVTSPTGTVCSGTTTSKGAFSCTYVEPATPGGAEKFTATNSGTLTSSATFTVVPRLVLAPASGLVGTEIHFLGTGFGGKAGSSGKGGGYGVDVNWTLPTGSRAVACTAITDGTGNGTFTCAYLLPETPGGAHAFTATSTNGSKDVGSGDFDVSPGLSVGPAFGPAGSTLTFTGTGFGATTTVAVSWVNGAACSGATPDTGSFDCTFEVPVSTPGGSYNFTARDGDGNGASVPFVVTYLEISPTGGSVGSTLRFSGGGYAADADIAVSWDGGSLCAGTESNGAGTFSCSYRLPPAPAGSYTFTASDGHGNFATADFTVEPALAVDPTYGDPGSSVTVSGTGFGSLLGVTVRYASNGSAETACTPTTDASGNFSCPFVLPDSTVGGTYTFTATDAANDVATATFVVTFLHATPARGPDETSVSLSAGGFAPGTSYTLSWGGQALSSSLCTTSSIAPSGTLSCSDSVGYRPAGPRAFELVDADGDSASAPFAVTTGFSVSPTRAEVHAKVTFALTGFDASSRVDVNWSNGTVACSVTTSKEGAANCSLTIPATAAGPYAFFASGSGVTESTLLTVLPSLVLRPTSGVGGSSIGFTGTGFGSSTDVSVTSSLGTACSLVTDANGTFACGYVVPYAPSGTYVFTAADDDSNTATASFQIGPVLNVSAASGPVGSLLAFSGTGFSPGRTANVTWTSGLACDARVGSSGGFSCSFSVPAAPTGSYTFTARDYAYPVPKNGHVGNTAAVDFQLLPSLSLTPSSATVGTTVAALGQGFRATSTVYVNDSTGGLCTGTTGASGTLSCSFPTPALAGGGHVITAASSPTVSASATLTVEPSLTLLPTAGAVGSAVLLEAAGLGASASVKFTWAGGTACTGSALADGLFDCSYGLPPTPSGVYTFDAEVDGTAVASASFQVEPSLSVSPNAGPVGTRASFAATGFGSDVSISIASSLDPACSGKTGPNGSYDCNYTIPSTANGLYTFTATDALDDQASAAFDVGAVLTVSPSSGPVGTALTFRGTGFAASTAIAVSWTGSTVCSGKTGPAGGYECNTTMPEAPLGAHTFTATAGPSASTTFTVTPTLRVAPGSGSTGTAPVFTGSGFPASSHDTVSWSGSTSCSATANASGGFTCSLSIPTGTAGGTYSFTASDGTGNTAQTTFEVVTGLSDDPTHGPATTSVTFTGSNFADSSKYNVTWNGGTACQGVTNATGGFACSYAIPSGTAGGAYAFTATDAALDSASVLFTVTSLSVSPTGVVAGATVEVSGGGFEPSKGFTVTAPWGTVCNGTADATGAIACSVTVPRVEPPGEELLTANDSFGDLASAGFGVFSIAAPTAAPATVDVNELVSFGVVASGGGTLTYAWSGLPENCSAATASFSCHPSAPVTDAAISVEVTDSDGYAITSPTLLFTVDPAPTQSPPTAVPSEGDIGVTIEFSAVVSGGSGGGSYAWSFSSGLGCTATTGPTLSCAPESAGHYFVAYNWTDSNGVTASGSTVTTYTVGANPTQAPPVPSRASADVGQLVRFAADVAGGSSGGSYAWSAPADLGCAATTGPTLSCTPTTEGTYTLSYVWTDGAGVTATGSTALSYTVDPDPTVGAPSASVGAKTVSSIDANQSVTFSVSPSGGSGGYTYTWSGLPSGCDPGGSSVVCTPTVQLLDASVRVKVTDSNDFNVTSAALAFNVYADPIAHAPTATPSSVDDGHSVQFQVVATGGSGGLSYVWSGLPSGCTGSGASFSCTPVAYGSFTVGVNVTDSNGFLATSPTLAFVVHPVPEQSPPKPTRPSADVGQGVNFTAQVTGGASGGSYVWSFGPELSCTATTGPQLNCTAASEGTASVSYDWTDGLGVAAGGGTTLGYTVFSDPTVNAPTSTLTEMDVGQAVTFAADASGGSGGFTYAWTSSAAALNCTASTTSTITCHPSHAGSYTENVTVTDSNGEKAKSGPSPSVTVSSALTVSVPTPNHPAADVDQTVMFMTTATGGTGTILFTWTAPSGLGCTTTSTATLVCDPTAVGSYTVSVFATDANNAVSPTESSAKFVVSSAPTLTIPRSTNASADLGQRITFSTTPSGGSGTFTFTWGSSVALAGLGCTASTTDEIVCVPVTEGTYTVTVFATDGNGATTPTESSAAFPIYVDPTVNVPTTPSKGADAGTTVSVDFSTSASGGTGHYTYTWTTPTGLGCTVRPAPAIACVPTAAGTYTVTVTATDADGVVSAPATSAAFTVYPAPAIVVTASPSSFLQGHPVTITGVVTGGSGSFTYAWNGLPNGCSAPTGPTLTCTPKDAGTYAVGITVTDSDKGTAFDNVTIDVKPSFLGLPAEEGYILVAIAFFGAVGVGLFFHLRNERRRAREVQHEF